ncbi:unnamed protein product [Amoebophrya sp. A120]|nr:unnamed protein product [Amoebophrya sp. A120]|eukprot:GSA120T00014881001.1
MSKPNPHLPVNNLGEPVPVGGAKAASSGSRSRPVPEWYSYKNASSQRFPLPPKHPNTDQLPAPPIPKIIPDPKRLPTKFDSRGDMLKPNTDLAQQKASLSDRSKFMTRNQITRDQYTDMERQIQVMRHSNLGKHARENNFLIPGIQSRAYTREELQIAFEAIDVFGTGEINADSLRDALQLAAEPVTEQEIANMIRLCDADAGGNLSFDEFRNLYESPSPLFKNFDMGNVIAQRMALLANKQLVSQKVQLDSGEEIDPMLRANQLYDLIEEIAAPRGGLKPALIKRLYENFLEVDTDGCGLLNFSEFCLAFETGLDNKQLKRMFIHFDRTGNQDIELKDVIVSFSIFTEASLLDKSKFAFLIFDDDNSGFLERKEVLQLLNATFVDKSEGVLEGFCEDIYAFLGMQSIHRLSFDNFLRVVKERPHLVMCKEAAAKSLRRVEDIEGIETKTPAEIKAIIHAGGRDVGGTTSASRTQTVGAGSGAAAAIAAAGASATAAGVK